MAVAYNRQCDRRRKQTNKKLLSNTWKVGAIKHYLGLVSERTIDRPDVKLREHKVVKHMYVLYIFVGLIGTQTTYLVGTSVVNVYEYRYNMM